MSQDQIVEKILSLPEGTRFLVLAPLVRGQKGTQEKVLADAKKGGYVRVRVDGSLYALSEEIKPDKNKKHDVEVVLDRRGRRINASLSVPPGTTAVVTDTRGRQLRLSPGVHKVVL